MYTEEELELLRGRPIRTTGWSWFYTPTRYPGVYQGYPFFKHLTAGWPLTYVERTMVAEGCFDPWHIHTEWYLGGLLVDVGVSAGLGALLFLLFQKGFRRVQRM